MPLSCAVPSSVFLFFLASRPFCPSFFFFCFFFLPRSMWAGYTRLPCGRHMDRYVGQYLLVLHQQKRSIYLGVRSIGQRGSCVIVFLFLFLRLNAKFLIFLLLLFHTTCCLCLAVCLKHVIESLSSLSLLLLLLLLLFVLCFIHSCKMSDH
jgi:hypothetical protein